MTKLVRFAVVGVTGYSRSHLEYVRRLADQGTGQLVASLMIDKDDHPDVVAEFEASGVRVFERYEDMLDACQGQVDIVTLPVPIYLHAPMTIAALRQGYHVLVEKPVAGCVTDADEMIATRTSSDRQCAVGFQQIYSPVIQRLKRYICEGRFGQVRRIHTMALWPRPPAYYARNNWAGKLTCAGRPVYDSPFNNALAHQVMNMLYLASSQTACAAYPTTTEAELFRAYDIESFDTGCMRVIADSGAELVFVASHACPVNIGPILKLEADLATVDCEIERVATIRYRNGSTETLEWDDARTHMLDNIVEAIVAPAAAPLCTLEIARAQVACTEAIHQAAQIQTIPQALISQLDDGQLVIKGIQEAIEGVYQSGKLFSEIGTLFA